MICGRRNEKLIGHGIDLSLFHENRRKCAEKCDNGSKLKINQPQRRSLPFPFIENQRKFQVNSSHRNGKFNWSQRRSLSLPLSSIKIKIVDVVDRDHSDESIVRLILLFPPLPRKSTYAWTAWRTWPGENAINDDLRRIDFCSPSEMKN